MKASEKRGLPVKGPDAPNWLLAYVVRQTVARLVRALWRVRTVNPERVPAGGAVLAGNHVSYLDPVVLWSACPRPTHFMAKRELWSIKPLGWLLDQFWAFPVDRSGSDREAISNGTRVLLAGDLLGVFPEGTRKRDQGEDMGKPHGGAAFLAMRAEVPVVPVAFVGTDRAWPAGQRWPRFVRVQIRFGEPISPDAFEGSRKERVAAMTDVIMERIDALRHEER